MPAKTEARIKNFTPLLDELVKRHGIVTAAVWGRVWRYARQENNICQASTEKLASELNLGQRTIFRHLDILTREGYIEDNTPDLRNRPHTYSITEKARILITIEAVNGMPENHSESQEGMPESHSTMPESHPHYAIESHEETIKKQIKKQVNEIPENLNTPEFIKAWDEWVVYRIELKKKLTESTANKQLKKLSEYAPPVAIGMIEQSIEHGWQGLFEVKDQPGGIIRIENPSW